MHRDTFRAAQTRAAATRQDSIVGMTISNIRLPTATSSQAASGYTGKEFTQGGGSPDAHRIPIQSARMHTSGRGATTLSDGAVSERDTQWLSHAVVKEIQLALTVEPRQQQILRLPSRHACHHAKMSALTVSGRHTLWRPTRPKYQRYGRYTIH